MLRKPKRKQGRQHWLRENHRSTCLPKMGHDTEDEAQAHIDSLVANGKAMHGALAIYRCLECHKLHVGHQSVIHGTQRTGPATVPVVDNKAQ